MKQKLKNIYKKLPFEFSFPNYKIIYIFLSPVFGVAHHRLRDKYVDGNLEHNEYFQMLLYFLSYNFSFIPLLIFLITYRTKNNITKEEIEKLPIKEEVDGDIDSKKMIVEKEIQKQKKKILLKNIGIILFLCVIGIIFSYFNIIGNTDKKTIGLSYKIPILFILSYLILKYIYYKHHYISFGLNILTLMTKYVLGIVQSNSEQWVLTHIWQYFVFGLSNSLLLIIGKYYMDKFNKTPYFLMFIIGLINSSILLIIAVVKYIAFSESYIFSCFSQSLNSTINIILFFADIICQFIYKLGFWITVYYFTPLHTIISENTIEIYYIIYDFESNKKYWEENGYVWNQYVIPTVLALNLIFSLIFNEIIILKCFKLDYYTSKRIGERERKDSHKLLKLIGMEFDNDSRSSLTSEDQDSINSSENVGG